VAAAAGAAVAGAAVAGAAVAGAAVVAVGGVAGFVMAAGVEFAGLAAVCALAGCAAVACGAAGVISAASFTTQPLYASVASIFFIGSGSSSCFIIWRPSLNAIDTTFSSEKVDAIEFAETKTKLRLKASKVDFFMFFCFN